MLVLSPFAGAGGLMQEAILANPYETHNSAAALDRALSMNLDERQLRMNQLKKRERRMDVDAWVRGFLEGMQTLAPISVPGMCYLGFFLKSLSATRSFITKKSIHSGYDPIAKYMEHHKMGNEFDSTLGHYVEMCSKLGIFLDFDGTLSPLARTPELAFIPPETKKVWKQQRRIPFCTIIYFNCGAAE